MLRFAELIGSRKRPKTALGKNKDDRVKRRRAEGPCAIKELIKMVSRKKAINSSTARACVA